MSISASTYKKIQSIKTWATNKLPTITEDSYTELLTDLLKYLDSLITNNDFFETDIQKIITELNKLLDKSFPTQDDITQAITTAKQEITTSYTEAINSAKDDITSKYTTAISESAKLLMLILLVYHQKLIQQWLLIKRILKTRSLVLWKI